MRAQMTSEAVVFNAPGRLELRQVELKPQTVDDLVVKIDYSGISTGTEKLLWQGDMPQFPGLGYPLVPGYEAVGTVVSAGDACTTPPGTRVFVPGSSCFCGDVRGLFGASASTLVVREHRTHPIGALAKDQAVLLALAATAMHILTHRLQKHSDGGRHSLSTIATQAPELIVGHGVLGQLLARLCLAVGAEAPVVWETNPARRHTTAGYNVIAQSDDDYHQYTRICDVSGAGGSLFDQLIARLARGGTLILGGFYSNKVAFTFPAAFMREVELTISAEWKPEDMRLVQSLIKANKLSLDGLVSHQEPAARASSVYSQAFNDPECLKMVLDWSDL